MITGGSFYQLENASSAPMIMMGNGSGPAPKNSDISYQTRKGIRQQVQAGFNN